MAADNESPSKQAVQNVADKHATGAGAVVIGGDARGVVIIPGHHNIINLGPEGSAGGREFALRPFRGNIPSRRNAPFVGRDGYLEEIGRRLDDLSRECVLILHGQPGVGKSELAKEFARRSQDRYTGGTFFIDFGSSAMPIDLARIGTTVLHLQFPAGLSLDDQCLQTMVALCSAPTLLLYDNVRSAEHLARWLPAAGMPCHLLVTTTLERWDPSWPTLIVEPLPLDASLQLIEEYAGRDIAVNHGEALASFAGGLPVQLCGGAAALVYEQRRGRVDSAHVTLAPEAAGSFRAVYDRLDAPSRLILRATAHLRSQHIPPEELFLLLEDPTGWSEPEFRQSLDACLDLHLLEGGEEIRMHQVLASYLVGAPLDPEITELYREVRRAQAYCMVRWAWEFLQDPGNADVAGTFLVFETSRGEWADCECDIPLQHGDIVARALDEIGDFEAALSWHIHAVEAKEKGDSKGEVDRESLASSLHAVGCCLGNMGKFDEAMPWQLRALAAIQEGDKGGIVDQGKLSIAFYQFGGSLSGVGKFEEAVPWYERAVEAAQIADVQGQVDHERIGRCLHQIGYCLAKSGKMIEARSWYERAANAKEEGDVDANINYESLGRSLGEVGNCLLRTGRFLESRPWYERAAAAHEKGDPYGRFNYDSLGGSLHQIGFSFLSVGEVEQARPWYERAVETKEKGDFFGRVDHESLGRTLEGLGDCLFHEGKTAEAIACYNRAIDAHEKGDVHGRVDYEHLGLCLHQLGSLLRLLADFKEAITVFERAVEAGQNGDIYGRVNHDAIGKSLLEFAGCLSAQSNFTEAWPFYERAVESARKGDTFGRINRNTLAMSLREGAACGRAIGHVVLAEDWEREAAATDPGEGNVDEAVAFFRLANALGAKGEFAKAEEVARRSLAILQRSDTEQPEPLIASLATLGVVCREQNKVGEAELLFRDAVRKWETLGKPRLAAVIPALAGYGVIKAKQGQLPEAKVMLDSAMEITESVVGAADTGRAATLNSYAVYFEMEGNADNAISMYRKALGVWEAAGWPNHPNVLVAFKNVILALRREGRFAELEPILPQAIKKYEDILGKNNREVAVCLNDLGAALIAQRRWAEGFVEFRKALAIWNALGWPDDGGIDTLHENLYSFALMHREFAIAVEAGESALAYARKQHGEQHPAIVRRLNDLGVAYREWHRFDLAAGYFEQAEAMANTTVGQEHPDLPLVLSNFARLRRAQGQRKMAEELEDHAERVVRRQARKRRRRQ